MPDITTKALADTIDKWTADVKAEAIELHRQGVPHDFCMSIAVKIVEAKDTGRARRLMEFGGARS